jgi:hypothetical protein
VWITHAPKLALRPCRIPEPSISFLRDHWLATPKPSVLKRASKRLYGLTSEVFSVWGFTATRWLGQEWAKVHVGDLMLFYAKGEFFAKSWIVGSIDDRALWQGSVVRVRVVVSLLAILYASTAI